MRIVRKLKALVRRAAVPDHRQDDPVQAPPAAVEGAWDPHLPAFLNAASSAGAFGRELVRMRDELEQQIRALRDQFAGRDLAVSATTGCRTYRIFEKPLAQPRHGLHQILSADRP
jgi:hypothetical protein